VHEREAKYAAAGVDGLREVSRRLKICPTIIAAGSYPKRIAGVYDVGGGPHFGSGLTLDTATELYGEREYAPPGRCGSQETAVAIRYPQSAAVADNCANARHRGVGGCSMPAHR
jgi:hypothetical protein